MKLYVGTYKKYNEGSLDGDWIDLDDFNCKEDFLEKCYEIHKDEDDPELMFQDNEYEYDWEEKFYSECSISEDYWEVKKEIERLHVDNDMFDAWLSNESCGNTPTAEDVKRALDQFVGKYNSDAEYAQEWYENSNDPLLKSNLANYIDWDEVFNYEFQYDTFSSNGYYFDSNR